MSRRRMPMFNLNQLPSFVAFGVPVRLRKRATPMTTHPSTSRAAGAALLAVAMGAATLLMLANAVSAAIVPSVTMGTAANYAVLGASTVTNTGGSTLDGSLGLWPGDSITGFPPGRVLPPGTTDTTNAAAQQAQSDLTVAYTNAAGRPVDATTTADLANLNLQAGVYSGPDRSPLSLTGPLVLDGGGDLTSVFIFQTDSTLITGSGSTVSLVNGVQECNVFWQVGSSATLGTDSVFTGNILALTSITVNNSVTVHGRALARNGAVTLDNDTFTKPTCAQPAPATTTTVVSGVTTPTTAGGDATTTGGTTTGAVPGGTGSATGTTETGDGSRKTPPGDATSTATARRLTTQTSLTSGGPGAPGAPGVPRIVGPPRTGVAPMPSARVPLPTGLAVVAVLFAATLGAVRTRRAHERGRRLSER